MAELSEAAYKCEAYQTKAMEAWRARYLLLDPSLATGDRTVRRTTKTYLQYALPLQDIMTDPCKEFKDWCNHICQFASWAPGVLTQCEAEGFRQILSLLITGLTKAQKDQTALGDGNILSIIVSFPCDPCPLDPAVCFLSFFWQRYWSLDFIVHRLVCWFLFS